MLLREGERSHSVPRVGHWRGLARSRPWLAVSALCSLAVVGGCGSEGPGVEPFNAPVKLRPSCDIEPLAVLADHELRRLVQRLDPATHRLTLSGVLHAWRLWSAAADLGLASSLPHVQLPDAGEVSIDELILGTGQSYRALHFQRTPYGIRVAPKSFRTPSYFDAYHRDELLCVLAEAGVPLTRPIWTSFGKYRVRNLLDDCIAQFSLTGELPWSAVALTSYLPRQQRGWRNKFGEFYDFDLLALALLRTELGEGPCQGTHVCYALACMANVHSQSPILSQATIGRVQRRIDGLRELLWCAQHADGAWRLGWETGTASRPPDRHAPLTWGASIAVTAHHLEWLALAGCDSKGRDAVTAGLKFLVTALEVASADELSRNYNAYTHAARAILLWSQMGDEGWAEAE